MKGYKQCCGFIQQIGGLTGNQDLVKVGMIGSHLVDVMQCVDSLKNLKSGLDSLGDMQNVLKDAGKLGDAANGIGALGAMAALGTAMTGVGAVLSIVSLFSGMNSGPSPEVQMLQQVMKQLEMISKQIHELHKTVVKGFNKVFERFDELTVFLNTQLIIPVKRDLSEVRNELTFIANLVEDEAREIRRTIIGDKLYNIERLWSNHQPLTYLTQTKFFDEYAPAPHLMLELAAGNNSATGKQRYEQYKRTAEYPMVTRYLTQRLSEKPLEGDAGQAPAKMFGFLIRLYQDILQSDTASAFKLLVNTELPAPNEPVLLSDAAKYHAQLQILGLNAQEENPPRDPKDQHKLYTSISRSLRFISGLRNDVVTLNIFLDDLDRDLKLLNQIQSH